MSDAPGAPGRPEPPQDPSERELIPHRPGEPSWMRVLGPIRSEGAAFRSVAWVAGAAIAVIALVLLVRAIS